MAGPATWHTLACHCPGRNKQGHKLGCLQTQNAYSEEARRLEDGAESKGDCSLAEMRNPWFSNVNSYLHIFIMFLRIKPQDGVPCRQFETTSASVGLVYSVRSDREVGMLPEEEEKQESSLSVPSKGSVLPAAHSNLPSYLPLGI